MNYIKPIGFLVGLAVAVLLASYWGIGKEGFPICAALSLVFSAPGFSMRHSLHKEVYTREPHETIQLKLQGIKEQSNKKYYTYLFCELSGGIAFFFIGSMLIFMAIALRSSGNA